MNYYSLLSFLGQALMSVSYLHDWIRFNFIWLNINSDWPMRFLCCASFHNQVEYNDRPNAELIMRTKKNADLVIRSLDF